MRSNSKHSQTRNTRFRDSGVWAEKLLSSQQSNVGGFEYPKNVNCLRRISMFDDEPLRKLSQSPSPKRSLETSVGRDAYSTSAVVPHKFIS